MSGLLCYTTSISAEKSIGEIMGMLAQSKACAIMQEFDGGGNVTALSFRKQTEFGEMTFRLPVETSKVHQVLKNQWQERKIPRSLANDSIHARRVAWRILRNWIEAQLALIEVGMVKVHQVFLPYMQDPATGKTLFAALEESKFEGLALPAPTSEKTA